MQHTATVGFVPEGRQSVPRLRLQACPQFARRRAHNDPTSLPIMCTPALRHWTPQCTHKVRVDGVRGSRSVTFTTGDARWSDCFIGEKKKKKKNLAQNTFQSKQYPTWIFKSQDRYMTANAQSHRMITYNVLTMITSVRFITLYKYNSCKRWQYEKAINEQ